MKRGDLFYVIPWRQLGKPTAGARSAVHAVPACGAQHHVLPDDRGAVDFVNPVRIVVTPTKGNGLAMPSLMQMDKLVTVDRGTVLRIASAVSPQRRRPASTPPCACGW